MRLGNPLRGEPPLVPSEYEAAGTRRASAEELWESFKIAIRERRFEDAAKLYSEFLRQPEVNAWLWYGNFTLGPFKAYPRASIPALLRFPAFRDFYSDILADIARPPRYPVRGVPSVSVPSARGTLGGKKTILYSSSDYEPVTHAGTLWFDTLVVPEIRRLGYTRRNIRDPLDHKPLFHQFLDEADLVIGCGHGSETTYTGGLQEPLLECGKYDPQAVKGGGAKLLSCLLGSQLLPELAQHGMWSQGYVKTYSFQWDPKYGFTKPENDPVIRLFFLPFMRATIGLLNGITNREAHDLEYSEYMTNAERTSDPEIRDLLIREANIFKVFGDPNARL